MTLTFSDGFSNGLVVGSSVAGSVGCGVMTCVDSGLTGIVFAGSISVVDAATAACVVVCLSTDADDIVGVTIATETESGVASMVEDAVDVTVVTEEDITWPKHVDVDMVVSVITRDRLRRLVHNKKSIDFMGGKVAANN